MVGLEELGIEDGESDLEVDGTSDTSVDGVVEEASLGSEEEGWYVGFAVGISVLGLSLGFSVGSYETN